MANQVNHSEKARELFNQGYNCSQAVFAAFCDKTGLDFTTALKVASSFGGGMGRMREVCGAVSGMFMVIGTLYGNDDTTPSERKTEHYAIVQEMARRFKEENGSIICRELLGLTQKSDPPTPEARTPEYYKKRPCAELVAMAAQIADDIIAEHEAKQ